jgi:hypothetical protein
LREGVGLIKSYVSLLNVVECVAALLWRAGGIGHDANRAIQCSPGVASATISAGRHASCAEGVERFDQYVIRAAAHERRRSVMALIDNLCFLN